MSKKVTNGGYSLVEIILYAVLLGMFLTAITSLFVSSVDLRLETEATSAVQQDGRYLVSHFRNSIVNADSVVTPALVGDEGDSLVLERGGTTYTYGISDENLIINDGINIDQLNSSRVRVTSMNFSRLGNPGGKNTITIDFTLESIVERAKGPEVLDFTVTYGVR